METFKTRIIFVFLSLVIFQSFASPLPNNHLIQNSCNSEACKILANNLNESIDANVSPCDNFYLYACGNWPKMHGIASGLLPSSTIQIRSDNNDKEILDFLKKNNSQDEPQAVHKARKLFLLCLNETANFKKGIQPVKDILTKIGLPTTPPVRGMENPSFDYIAANVKAFKTLGMKMFFDIGVEPNPYNQTVNVIGLSKPSPDELDPDTVPLNQRAFDVSEVALTVMEILKQGITTMCENNTSLFCSSVAQPWDFVNSIIITRLLEYDQERGQIISKARPKVNTTATYTLITLQELQNITDTIAKEDTNNLPKLNWTKYIELVFADVENVTLDLSDPKTVQIAVYEMDFIEEMIRFIYNYSLQKHEFGLWWSIVSKLLPYTDAKISELTEKLEGEIMNKKNSEEKCAERVNSLIGMASSYYYTTKEQYSKIKEEVRDMVENIRDSFKELIEQTDWMDKKTKEKSLKKIKALKSNIVFPSVIKSTKKLDEFYSDLELTDNFLESALTKTQRHIQRELSKYNQINDLNEDRWELTPNMVNAFYDPAKNTITIPAGILGAPVYTSSLRAIDYGGIGTVLGHEITHGFDNAGRRYNEVGNVEDWWEPDTLETYKSRAKCFIEAYDKYNITMNEIVQKVDSKASFGENIADNGGFKEALLAYRKYVTKNGEEPVLPQFENFTHEQLFTLGFANMWCENPTILSSLLAQYLDHSPGGVRVNGVLKNSEEFAKIWKCPKGSGMNPDKKCSLW